MLSKISWPKREQKKKRKQKLKKRQQAQRRKKKRMNHCLECSKKALANTSAQQHSK